MTEAERAKRNLNPHKPARIAMWLWSHEYAHKQRGGSMDFWDSLTESRKQKCRDFLTEIMKSEDEPK